MFRNYLDRILENKENNDGKFGQMCCWFLVNFFDEKSNVKMGSTGRWGGGGTTIEKG
jgi:hypothetical protein